MTIDQTHMVHDVLQYVYGLSWDKQIISRTNMIPMLSGIQHEEALASCIPYSPSELHKAIQLYGFEYRTLLGQFQHLCQWTRLDIQTAVQRLAQYQNAPGSLHFDALLQIAKYLRQYPDIHSTCIQEKCILAGVPRFRFHISVKLLRGWVNLLSSALKLTNLTKIKLSGICPVL